MNGRKHFEIGLGQKIGRFLHWAQVVFRAINIIKITQIPIIGVLLIAELINRRGYTKKPSGKKPVPLKYKSGLSIIIPERGSVPMLEDCLKAAFISLQEIHEPFEVIVVINGSPMNDYNGLKAQFAGVTWVYISKPLGFTGAIRVGLDHAHFDWVYLLNNDMFLTPEALKNVLTWKSPNTFAIASQILFRGGRPRLETGWTTIRIQNGRVEPSHLIPDDQEAIRGAVYAGAGSSLFNRYLLKKIIRNRDPYHPFYWEDVDWSNRAWKLGYQVLFCPTSVVFHDHRITISHYYDKDTVERIFERNRLQFQFYNPMEPIPMKKKIKQIITLDPKTFREIGNIRNCIGILAASIWTYRAPYRNIPWKHLAEKYYSKNIQSL